MRISDKEIKDALIRSGYFLETRVLSVLSKNGYKNFPNETYPDPVTKKSREIDIISHSPRITDNIKLNQFLHFEYQYHLIFECINNLQPIAFFKRPDKSPYTIHGKFFYSKEERQFSEEENKKNHPADIEFLEYTTSSKHFHYNQLEKNTQYCSFSPKKGNQKEWMASHPDALHDTFNKLTDYTTHTNKSYDKWLKKSAWRNDVSTFFFFPVLIVQNDLIEVSEINGKVIIEKKDHLIFNYNKYSEEKDGFLIDVITEKYLEAFLVKVNTSVVELKNIIVEYYKGKEITEIKYPNSRK